MHNATFVSAKLVCVLKMLLILRGSCVNIASASGRDGL